MELEAGSGIFAEKGVLCSIEHFGKRAAGVALALFNMVFTPQALVSLSVKGKGPRVPIAHVSNGLPSTLEHSKLFCASYVRSIFHFYVLNFTCN